MGINTAISGMLAANTDLKVTGNNIANSSTVGFKQSRAELSDLYTRSMNGSNNNVGSGVRGLMWLSSSHKVTSVLLKVRWI